MSTLCVPDHFGDILRGKKPAAFSFKTNDRDNQQQQQQLASVPQYERHQSPRKKFRGSVSIQAEDHKHGYHYSSPHTVKIVTVTRAVQRSLVVLLS